MAVETPSAVRSLVDAYLEQVNTAWATDRMAAHNLEPTGLEAGRAMLELPREQQVAVIRHIVARQVELINGRHTCGSHELSSLLTALFRKKLPISIADLETLVRGITPIEKSGWWSAVSPGSILRAVEEAVSSGAMPESLRDALGGLAAQLRGQQYYADSRKLLQRVESLLKQPAGEPGPTVPFTVELTTDEAWTRALRAALHELAPPARAAWDTLLVHCRLATASKPSRKWLDQAKTRVDALGPDAFAATLATVLPEIGKPGTPPAGPVNALGFNPDPTQVHETHSDLLRGLVWCTGLVENDALIGAVGDAADACFKKLAGIGPRAPKIGNACLWALANLSSTAAVAQLSRLKSRAKHASVKTQLGKALGTAAGKTGMSAEELEEVVVPTCGLTAVGEQRQQLGDYTACLRVSADLKAEVSWLKPDGKEQTSVPAAVKEAFAGEVQALKRREKEIAKLLPAQRDRIERLLGQERTWALADFRSRYLDHPLVGTIARRLIWRFGNRAAAWHDGKLVDRTGQVLEAMGDETRVALWHPIAAEPVEVKAWRDWLEAHQVCQPFKQAHREVYILTDAERQTAVYSNRFAAHVLKQHQFAALCQQRGWTYRLQGEWDSANTPTLVLPAWGLRAEFWVEQIRAEGPLMERGDLSHLGVSLYLTTDQVRFYRGAVAEPLPLAEVPPLVFSEVMRDLDLFVGVAGAGNDPTWVDGGLFGRYREYWESYALGTLFPSAQTRKETLERLVPRLKIAERCSFTDRFLVVRGDLRTYKIHLGSGNILMSPNDQYLCIVAKQGAAAGKTSRVYLPFDGDPMLSIVLSKALLLAEDTKITDPTIVRQIQRAE